MFSRKGKDREPTASASGIYLGLRKQALQAVARGTLSASPSYPRVGGAVVDIPATAGFSTLVALGNGTVDLYTSVGGGTIAAGGHPHVAEATYQLLAAIDAHLDWFSKGDDDALPGAGTVRFHVLAFAEPRSAYVPEDAFWGREQHALSAVIAATQHLVGAVQSVQ